MCGVLTMIAASGNFLGTPTDGTEAYSGGGCSGERYRRTCVPAKPILAAIRLANVLDTDQPGEK